MSRAIDAKINYILRLIKCSTIFKDDFENFPTEGKGCTLYVDKETGAIYIWDGTDYITSSGGGGGLDNDGTGAATRVAFWKSPTALGGSTDLFWDDTTKFLGVGTATPQTKLQISGAASVGQDALLRLDKPGFGYTDFLQYQSSGGEEGLRIKGRYIGQALLSLEFVQSRVGINIETPTARLDVNGDLRVRSISSTPTTILGADASGYLGNITLGTGLSLVGGALSATASGLTLGETNSTAYRGDRGKIAYDHSLLTSGNPHSVTKADVGLSNVQNTDLTTAVGLNTAKVTNATHTGDVTGSVALTITAKAVTLPKMADMATGSLIYRKTAGTGVPEVNTLATLKTDLGLTGTNSGDVVTFYKQKTVTLIEASWVADSGIFRYTLTDAEITATSLVDVIIGNTSVTIVQAAEVLPSTVANAGSVYIYSTNAPTGDIDIAYNIIKVV